jgi:adenosylcobinamide kinase/adenosylcobinamide-phosphate guanylyltransferase
LARIILVTGGSRSGKSNYAEELAEALPGPRVFVATCPVIDDEMRERIRKHQEHRAKADWHTVEEPSDPAGVLLKTQGYRVFLIDCLTLWINNLMYGAEQQGLAFSEEDMVRSCTDLIEACSRIDGTVILVTNEVGSGIVPENAAARLFRDLVGRCNQTIARAAHDVFLLSCGLPITLKKGTV